LQSAVSIVCSDISSAGSGVIYKLDKETGSAFIITNHHVVYDADKRTKNGISQKILVYFYGSEMDGFEIPAEYVGGSMQYDIAVLYIKESERLKESCMVPATIANSDKTVVGEAAIAIGNAKGAGTSACYGVVSVASEYLTMLAADNKTTVTYRVLRVDTAVNSGNSGGGLYNEAGELMGIVNAKIMDSTVENIGYAIPSNVAVSVAENLIDYCFGTELESVQRGMLGITVASVDSKAVREEGTGNIYIYETVEVQEVLDGSLVKGLILPGDRLRSISSLGKTVSILRRHHVVDAMLDARIGDEISICLIRDGKEITVKVIMTEEHVTEY
jgi:serine protease Do